MVYCAQRRDGSSRDKHWDSFSVKSEVVGVPVQLGLAALLVAGGGAGVLQLPGRKTMARA